MYKMFQIQLNTHFLPSQGPFLKILIWREILESKLKLGLKSMECWKGKTNREEEARRKRGVEERIRSEHQDQWLADQ